MFTIARHGVHGPEGARLVRLLKPGDSPLTLPETARRQRVSKRRRRGGKGAFPKKPEMQWSIRGTRGVPAIVHFIERPHEPWFVLLWDYGKKAHIPRGDEYYMERIRWWESSDYTVSWIPPVAVSVGWALYQGYQAAKLRYFSFYLNLEAAQAIEDEGPHVRGSFNPRIAPGCLRYRPEENHMQVWISLLEDTSPA